MSNRSEKRFGRYEVVAEIGRGAMGAVYKARDPKIDRFVAIKSISAISQSPDEELEYRQRFFHEAQAAGRLIHPGIVTIFDVGEVSESHVPYLVMEYVSGQSLSGLLSSENSRLPLDDALRLSEEIADALDCAHSQGVVHRDIKPANILLTEDGHPKIADFGIAKLNLSNVTLPGLTLGTPAYMSPEQVDGKPTDGRSDLFSLGVILYSMVTGHRPFQGTSAVTVCYKVANSNPLPATSFDMDLPPEIDGVIAKAIAKDPEQRYQRGDEFARAIRDVRRRLSNGARVSSDTRKNVMPPQAAPIAARPAMAGKPAPTRSPDAQPELSKPYLVLACVVVALGFGIIRFGIPFRKHSANAGLLPQASLVVAKVKPPVALVAPASLTEPSTVLDPIVPESKPPKPAKVRLPSKQHAVIAAAPPALVQISTPSEPAAPVAQSARLKIEVQHHFAEGKLSLWVDEKLAYSTDLHGTAKKRLALFHDVTGSDFAEVQVSAGRHTLRVNGQSGAHNFDESKTITADFETGCEKVLRVDFEKSYREMRLVLQ